MPLHHFLPATYLGLFSLDKIPERRKRIISVGDKQTGKILTAPASKLCGINDLYTLQDFPENPQLIDSMWSYESDLRQALEHLIDRSINAMTWAQTLIPFITDLLIRGPDFNRRFEKRIDSLGLNLNNPDNTNFARLMERQRLLSSVLAAKWIVVHKVGNIPIVTSDLGYTPFGNPHTDDFGIAVPIGLEHILCISPVLKRAIAFGMDGAWLPVIDYVESPVDDHIGFNKAIAGQAQRFIFGPDKQTIELFMPKELSIPTQVPEPGELGFMDGNLAMVHEMTWFKLITALSKPPKNGTYLTVDYLSKTNIPPEYRHLVFGE